MLSRYRRRFVAINMSLVALVLALTLLMQGVQIYRSEYGDLQKTMGLVMAPWRFSAGAFAAEAALPEQPRGDSSELPPQTGLHWGFIGEDEIVTVLFDSDGDMRILPGGQSVGREAVALAAEAAAQKSEEFGVLPEYRVYYQKGGREGSLIIALADTSYLAAQVRDRLLDTLWIYGLALALMFLVSLWLSKLAARPMEQAMEMERQFVADISHDLKTPITVVLANNSILKGSPEASIGEQMQWIDSTDDAARNMMHLVEQMLTLSSLEASEQTVEKHPVSLSALAEKSVLQFESLAYDRGVTLQDDIAGDVSVLADEKDCMRILNGLIENALKYEPSGGSVAIRLAREKKKAVLTVSNPGSRIAPEDLGHIFERFYRGDKTRGDHGGHGLGLPIVKQLCDSLGAEIRVRSNENEGTVFDVSFELV